MWSTFHYLHPKKAVRKPHSSSGGYFHHLKNRGEWCKRNASWVGALSVSCLLLWECKSHCHENQQPIQFRQVKISNPKSTPSPTLYRITERDYHHTFAENHPWILQRYTHHSWRRLIDPIFNFTTKNLQSLNHIMAHYLNWIGKVSCLRI